MFKNSGTKIVIGFVLSVFLLPGLLYALSYVKDKNYVIVNNSRDRMAESKASIRIKGGSNITFDEVIQYNDAWFENKSDIYNHELAKASLLLSLSTFSSGDIIENWGENGDFGRADSLKKAFEDLSFVNDEYFGYDISLNSTESKVAFGVAMKKFYVDNVASNVVVIAIRSGGYGCEWVDNFNVGNDSNKFHKGFYESALKAKEKILEYTNKNCKDGSIKYWICGYSRGGAVANILASMIDNEDSVYAYTFASPNTVEYNDTQKDEYDNIFNIINPYDPVVTLPPQKWGFGKIGITMEFPKPENNTDSKLYDIVSDNYYNLTGSHADLFVHSSISNLMNVIISFVKDRNEYENDIQKVFQDLATVAMTKVEVNGIWEKIDFQTFINDKFGEKVSVAMNESENCSQYQFFKSLGIQVPKPIKQLDIVLRLYDYDCPEKLLLESMTLDSIDSISSLTDSNAFQDFAVGHYPEVYISWMKTLEKTDFVIVNHK